MKHHKNKKYTEMKEIWLLVSVRYAFSQFKFNFRSNGQGTSSSSRKQVAHSKHSTR